MLSHSTTVGDVASLDEEKLAQNAESSAYIVVHNLLKYAKFIEEQEQAKKMMDGPKQGNSRNSSEGVDGLRPYQTHSRIKIISLGKYDGN